MSTVPTKSVAPAAAESADKDVAPEMSTVPTKSVAPATPRVEPAATAPLTVAFRDVNSPNKGQWILQH